MDIVAHLNPSLPHQREHGEWLSAGLKRHGLKLTITSDISLIGDIHIISGPHYAKKQFLNVPRTLLIDRSYFNQIKSGKWYSEDWISIGWMNNDGGRDFRIGNGRKPPEPKARRSGSRTLFLADYDGPIEQADTVRLHPARDNNQRPLLDDLHRHDIAIGYRTTALVTAGLEGLQVICKDPQNIMYHDNWLDILPYADWHYSEIQSGEAWAHLF